jgi:hypothetical protein
MLVGRIRFRLRPEIGCGFALLVGVDGKNSLIMQHISPKIEMTIFQKGGTHALHNQYQRD